MKFDEYYKMWDEHGIKLKSEFEITKEIMDMADQQNDI